MNDYDDGYLIADQFRRNAVGTALMFLKQGMPDAALCELVASVHTCAHFDHRPLDPGRVELRANKLLAEWGNPRPVLVAA